MKKLTWVIGLVLVLSMALAAQAMAAPSVTVSAKYMYADWTHTSGLELGIPLNDNWTVLVQGGVCPSCFSEGVALAGIRYYVTPEGLRPFATLYTGAYAGYGEVYWNILGTVGLEYLSPSGFRVAGEVGGGFEVGNGGYVAGGVAVGWAF